MDAWCTSRSHQEWTEEEERGSGVEEAKERAERTSEEVEAGAATLILRREQ